MVGNTFSEHVEFECPVDEILLLFFFFIKTDMDNISVQCREEGMTPFLVCVCVCVCVGGGGGAYLYICFPFESCRNLCVWGGGGGAGGVSLHLLSI